MVDNSYAPSPLGGVTPSPVAPSYAPSQLGGAIPSATTGYLATLPPKPAAAPAPSAYAMSPLDYTAHLETGDRNIPQQIHDRNTDKGTPAQGNWQFIIPTWRRQAPKAGVDIRQYPTPMSAPRDVQARVAAVTPGTEFGPRTQAGLKAKYPGIDLSKPLGFYGGTGGGANVPSPSATPGTTINTQPPAPSIANAFTGGTGADGKGLSPIQQLQKDLSPPDQSQAPAADSGIQLQQAAGMGVHNQQVAAQAPQLAATWRAAAAQPLSWGSKPFGSATGLQETPSTSVMVGGQSISMPAATRMPGVLGTTLNSNSDLYG